MRITRTFLAMFGRAVRCTDPQLLGTTERRVTNLFKVEFLFL